MEVFPITEEGGFPESSPSTVSNYLVNNIPPAKGLFYLTYFKSPLFQTGTTMELINMYGVEDTPDTLLRRLDLFVTESTNVVLKTPIWLASLLHPESSFLQIVSKTFRLVYEVDEIKSPSNYGIYFAAKEQHKYKVSEPRIIPHVITDKDTSGDNLESKIAQRGMDGLNNSKKAYSIHMYFNDSSFRGNLMQ